MGDEASWDALLAQPGPIDLHAVVKSRQGVQRVANARVDAAHGGTASAERRAPRWNGPVEDLDAYRRQRSAVRAARNDPPAPPVPHDAAHCANSEDYDFVRNLLAEDAEHYTSRRHVGELPSPSVPRRKPTTLVEEISACDRRETRLHDVLPGIVSRAVEGLEERHDLVAAVLLGVLSRHHVFLLGPPGTAKSLVARRTAGIFADLRYFECLLSRFTTMDEVFGPISLSSLEKDEYCRMYDGFLPTANVAFLDELVHASPSLQHALLSAMQERVFHNGRQRVSCPLRCVISASNEPPDPQSSAAITDRFVIRARASPMSAEAFLRLLVHKSVTETHNENGSDEPLALSQEHLDHWETQWRSIPLDDDTVARIVRIRARIARECHENAVSDRRWIAALDLMRVHALSRQDGTAVHREDLVVLERVFPLSVLQWESCMKVLIDEVLDVSEEQICGMEDTLRDCETLLADVENATEVLLSPDGDSFLEIRQLEHGRVLRKIAGERAAAAPRCFRRPKAIMPEQKAVLDDRLQRAQQQCTAACNALATAQRTSCGSGSLLAPRAARTALQDAAAARRSALEQLGARAQRATAHLAELASGARGGHALALTSDEKVTYVWLDNDVWDSVSMVWRTCQAAADCPRLSAVLVDGAPLCSAAALARAWGAAHVRRPSGALQEIRVRVLCESVADARSATTDDVQTVIVPEDTLLAALVVFVAEPRALAARAVRAAVAIREGDAEPPQRRELADWAETVRSCVTASHPSLGCTPRYSAATFEITVEKAR